MTALLELFSGQRHQRTPQSRSASVATLNTIRRWPREKQITTYSP